MDGAPLDTGLRKFGALLGDRCEMGWNSVLAPATSSDGPPSLYPSLVWRGILPTT